MTQKELDEIAKKFKVYDSDVFVVAYPKSGTTWMEQIVHLLRNNGEQGDQVLSEAVPWVEGAANRYDGLSHLMKPSSPRRYFHSHLPYSLMPGVSHTKAKYIYIARNPKDNAVSFYYHCCSKLNYNGSWQDFFDLYVQGKVGYGFILDHILEWWHASIFQKNIIFLHYEQVHKNIENAISQVANFIDISLNDTLRKSVATKSSFASMKSNSLANLDWVPQRKGFPKHMRRGIIGDWRNYFSDAQNAIFDDLCKKKLAGTELTFDFG
ncbi:sulfotransferase domain-containing protein [Candidatus Uabimicrobium sp. HlEnr_7]|uniref:sulfotransferase domain-containing protein n=1 Tax=Candidatus Uabimicrobium helgolandensis TaxID=3095367 RepID=UPI003555F36D